VYIIIFYFLIISIWLDKCVGFHLEEFLDLSIGFSLPNMCLYLFIVVWLLTLKTRDSFFQQNNLNRYLFILMVMTGISIFSNLYGYGIKETSLFQEMRSYKGLITSWLFFFLITSIIRNKTDCERSLSALILFLLATVFAVVIENFLGVDLGTHKTATSYKGRSAGFAEANQYAAYLILFLPLFVSFIFLHEKPSMRIKGFIYLLLGSVGLTSAVSKGGFISFFISLGYFFHLTIRRKMTDAKKVFFLMSLLFVVVSLAYLFLPSQTKEAAKTRLTLQEQGHYNPWASERSLAWKLTSGRTDVWAYSFQMITQKPILGYGNGACQNQLGLSPHSDPLKWIVNHGIVGFLLFSMVYIQIFRHVMYHFKTTTDPQSRMLYLGYLSGFIGYVVAMCGVNLFEPRLLFWIYTALVYSYSQFDVNRAH
jgi:O-antigen ligase